MFLFNKFWDFTQFADILLIHNYLKKSSLARWCAIGKYSITFIVVNKTIRRTSDEW